MSNPYIRPKVLFLSILLFACNPLLGQNTEASEEASQAVTVLRDSTEILLKDMARTRQIDSLWLAALYDTSRYDEAQEAVQNPWDSIALHDSLWSTQVFKERLADLDARTPFHVTYNASLEQIVRGYLKNRRESMARLIGLSHYYFPMFEEVMAQYGLPLEMKYLAIVESALAPTATSRVGARGLWQFMFQTGKMFGLEVNSYVDDRCDPLQSTIAAAQYLNKLYRTLGDWDLALAAYNSGPGNVSKAIRRSGGRTNYWNIRSFLPRETAGYVPAFLATMYLFEYAQEYGLKTDTPSLPYMTTDTVRVREMISLEQVARVSQIELSEIEFLNPSYSLGLIPVVKDHPYYLRLPLDVLGVFVAHEDSIYALAQNEFDQREQPLPELMNQNNRIRYRVRSGDYLGKIAEKFGVSVQKIKQWNSLKSNRLSIGQRLTIIPRRIPVAQNNPPTASKGQVTNGRYVVRPGDSLWSIAQKFPQISIDDLKKWNDISGNTIKPGMSLRIKKES
ncbi:MAG: LysM peptidoglycan-binding domain-containing protein [Flavobacteriaceae bacterium]|nr:LysM peptidoglycan-binding domain-containing protein [Flavobacteriaceae bacterium]